MCPQQKRLSFQAKKVIYSRLSDSLILDSKGEDWRNVASYQTAGRSISPMVSPKASSSLTLSPFSLVHVFCFKTVSGT